MKNINTIPIPTISRSQTDRFASSNGPFELAKWTVLERQMACFSNPLNMRHLQSQTIWYKETKYFYTFVVALNRQGSTIDDKFVVDSWRFMFAFDCNELTMNYKFMVNLGRHIFLQSSLFM